MSKLSVFWIAILVSLFLLPIASAQQPGACAGFTSRLGIGLKGKVTPGAANNVRSEATTGSRLLGSLRAGTELTILRGPQCADGITWWQVNANGLVGWTGEGRGNQYWLEPLRNSNVQSGNTPSSGLQGIATSGLGAGPIVYVCEYVETGEFVPTGIYNKFTELTNGQDVDLRDYALDMVEETFPALCFQEPVTSAVAIAPDGTEYSAYINHLEGGTQVQLPLSAVLQAGTWYLAANNLELFINVPEPAEVMVIDDQHLMLIWGLQPHEHIVVVYEGESDQALSVQAQADAQGAAMLVPALIDPDSLSASSVLAVVGEQGSLYRFEAFQHYYSSDNLSAVMLPEEAINYMLYSAFWNDHQPSITQCPGFSASRLRLGSQAETTSARPLLIYDEFSFEPTGEVITVPGGAELHMIYGMICTDEGGMWLADYDGNIGMILENNATTYWLELIQ